MKAKFFILISIFAIISLLAFQTMILNDAYRVRKESMEKDVKVLFRTSVEKEVSIRRDENETIKNASLIHANREFLKNDTVYSNAQYVSEERKLNDSEIIEAGIFQLLLHDLGHPFNIQTLDSIFGSELRGAGLNLSHTLIFRDSLGTLIEQTKELTPKKMSKAFTTEALLIVEGRRVQAHVVISPPAVYKTMFELLVSSFLIMAFLIYFLIHQTKTIFTQEKLDKLKTDFIQSFIHNIKSPIGTIKTVLMQLIKSELDNKRELKERLGDTALMQIESLLLQSEKILTIAKYENGIPIIHRTKTDVNEMIAELKDKFSISSNKQISIRTSVSIDGDQDTYFDRSLIREALSNLIDNAIKYSGNSVKVSIDCHTSENVLQFRVTDNGYGISEKDQRHIFEKFERGAAIKRREAIGFGLGLSYVKLVTEAHGGVVSLFSQMGEGSEFSISIPYQENNLQLKKSFKF